VTDRRRHQRPYRPKSRPTRGTGRKMLAGGIPRLCDLCSIDHAREWRRTSSGGWICDRCWRRRFD
jgi:hypothetical protein